MAAVNVGVAHSNQWNFLQNSEEPAGRIKSRVGPDLARGPEFETPGLNTSSFSRPSEVLCRDVFSPPEGSLSEDLKLYKLHGLEGL